jgi:two-component system nitrogen regulation response regulator NtrX
MAQATGRPSREFSEEAIATLQVYTWPGNVRELRNVVERVLIMAPGDTNEAIRSDMIPAEITSLGQQSDSGLDRTEFMGLPLREAREIFEREYLGAQVNRFGGNISKTATFIGMERSALHRKIKSLGLHSDDRVRAAND